MIDSIRKIQIKIVYFYAILMVTLFPLFFYNIYYDINEAKLYLFLGLTLCATLFVLILMAMSCVIQKKICIKKPNGFDMGVLCIVAVSLISTLLSKYSNEAFFGTYGRGTGLLFTTCLSCAYYLITRFMKVNNVFISYFLLTSAAVYFLGILNYFQIDPFRFFVDLSDYQGMLYTSTIGNINFFGTYICLTLPICLYIFCETKVKKNSIIYGMFCVLGFSALIISNCDGAHVAIVVILLIYFMWMKKSYPMFMKICSMIVIYIVVAKLLYAVSVGILSEHTKYLHTISYMIGSSLFMWSIVVCLVCMMVFCRVNRKCFGERVIQRRLHYTFVCICLIVIVILLFLLIASNAGYDVPFNSYLSFNENWGTGRLYIWSHAFEAYSIMSPLQKIFGYGPDTFRLLFIDTFGNNFSLYDNAHNEYIQMLTTIGMAGLFSYLFLYVNVFIKVYKNRKNEMICCIAASILCYMVQAIANINQPITFPVFFILLSCLINILNNNENVL